MLLAVIAACEIGFWVLLAAGMATRYLLRLPQGRHGPADDGSAGRRGHARASVIDIHSRRRAVVQALTGGDLHRGQCRLRSSDAEVGRRLGGVPVRRGAAAGEAAEGQAGEGAPRARRAGTGTWSRTSSAVGVMIALGLLSGKGYDAAARPGGRLDRRAGDRRDRLVQLQRSTAATPTMRRRRRSKTPDIPDRPGPLAVDFGHDDRCGRVWFWVTARLCWQEL